MLPFTRRRSGLLFYVFWVVYAPLMDCSFCGLGLEGWGLRRHRGSSILAVSSYDQIPASIVLAKSCRLNTHVRSVLTIR